jgi:hypothetical protein
MKKTGRLIEFPRRLTWKQREVYEATLSDSDISVKIEEMWRAPIEGEEEGKRWHYVAWRRHSGTTVISGMVKSETWEGPKKVVEQALEGMLVIRPLPQKQA